MPKSMRKPVQIGDRYTRLEVIAFAGRNEEGRRLVACRCDCGKETVVTEKHLRSGNTKSCGCLKKENGIKANTTHGMSKTRLYRIWAGMKDRCYRTKAAKYPSYGGRGIEVCAEWKNNFSAFADWAEQNGYAENLSIDRLDVNGNYCPENCRWASESQQANNKTTSIFVAYHGETHTLTEWARITGVNYYTLHNRYEAGKVGEALFSKQVRGCIE